MDLSVIPIGKQKEYPGLRWYYDILGVRQIKNQ